MDDPTIVFDAKAMSAAYPDKFNNAKEFSIVEKVRKRFEKMRQARRSTCPFPSFLTDSISIDDLSTSDFSVASGGGYSWENLWDMSNSLYHMKRQYVEGISNLKSGTTFSVIEGAMSEFSGKRYGVTYSAKNEEDECKILPYKEYINHLENTGDFKVQKDLSFKSTLKYGTAWDYVTRVRQERDVELILAAPQTAKSAIQKIMEGSDENQKELLQKRLDSGKPLTKKERIVEYDDIQQQNISIYEIYPDPDGRVMRGAFYEVVDLVWRTIPSLENFKSEFRNSSDPFLIKENISKVKGAGVTASSYEKAEPFFSVASDLASRSNNVEVLRYYNKQTDKYIIIANDILIRNGPLPYNHKQIPFVHHKLFDIDQNLFGLGLPYYLEGVQSEDEALRNLMIQKLHIETLPPVFIKSDLFADSQSAFTHLAPNQVIETSQDITPSSLYVYQGSPTHMDYFALRNTFDNEATKISGLNPLAIAIPTPNESVRNNMMGMESTMKSLRKMIGNWAQGEKEAKRQEIALISQFHSDLFSEGLDDKGNQKYKKIKIQGYKLTPEYEEQTELEGNTMISKLVNIKMEPSMKPEPFELRDEYFDLRGDIDVDIDVDSFPLISQALKLSKLEQAMDRLVPILANPSLLQAPGVNSLVRSYIQELDLENTDEILEQLQQNTTDEDVKRADEQNQYMQKGIMVPGMPGESYGHKMVHIAEIANVMNKLKDPNLPQEEIQNLTKEQQLQEEHLREDHTPKPIAPDTMLQLVAQGNQMARNIVNPMMGPGQQPMNPMNGQMSPMMGPGNSLQNQGDPMAAIGGL